MQSLSIFVVAPPKRMDVFSAPTIGSAEAIQGRDSTAGTSVDIIYPVSKLVKGQFQPGRTLEFNWKSSPERWWHPKSTRLVVHYKACFGEVDSTCRSATTGPTASNGVHNATLSRSHTIIATSRLLAVPPSVAIAIAIATTAIAIYTTLIA
eukprot:COSAG02_NODE_3972_length_5970_cov_4.166582_3_plen_151_part_00